MPHDGLAAAAVRGDSDSRLWQLHQLGRLEARGGEHQSFRLPNVSEIGSQADIFARRWSVKEDFGRRAAVAEHRAPNGDHMLRFILDDELRQRSPSTAANSALPHASNKRQDTEQNPGYEHERIHEVARPRQVADALLRRSRADKCHANECSPQHAEWMRPPAATSTGCGRAEGACPACRVAMKSMQGLL